MHGLQGSAHEAHRDQEATMLIDDPAGAELAADPAPGLSGWAVAASR